MTAMKLDTLIVKLLPVQKRRLEKCARLERRTMSVITRHALELYFERSPEFQAFESQEDRF